jgi:hypothetical protein
MNNYMYILNHTKALLKICFVIIITGKYISFKLHHKLYNDESYDINISIS